MGAESGGVPDQEFVIGKHPYSRELGTGESEGNGCQR